MSQKLVFMFAGQGSQYYRMGQELYEQHAGFRECLDGGSRLAEGALGVSLVDLLYGPGAQRSQPFERTRFTHPAIFLVNLGVATALRAEGLVPAAVLGYSLGEMVAWTAAGALTLEAALRFVIQTAALVEDGTPAAGMLAVLASPTLPAERPEVFAGTTVACTNYPGHFVVAGRRPDLLRAQTLLRAQDVVCQVLPIQHGFHSPMLDPIRDPLRAMAQGLKAATPRLPVVSCMAGKTLTAAEFTPEYCWQVWRAPVRFAKTIQGLEAEGAPWVYVDAGPSGTLAGFAQRVPGKHPASRALAVLSPFGADLRNLARVKRELGG